MMRATLDGYTNFILPNDRHVKSREKSPSRDMGSPNKYSKRPKTMAKPEGMGIKGTKMRDKLIIKRIQAPGTTEGVRRRV